MKIDPNRPVSPATVRKDSRGTGAGGDFAGNLRVAGEEEGVAPAAGPSSLSGIEALFALQEVPDPTAERKRARARGNRILDRLEDLRMGLLLGHIPRDKLAELAHLAREGTQNLDDPILREILQEIELRAEVELAKLSMED
jgi:hypothetical protein